LNQDAIYCPFCSKPLDNLPPPKHSAFLTTSGILIIIASIFALLIGLISLIAGSISYRYGGYVYLVFGIFGISSFALGLTAGIMALKKNSMRLVMIFEFWMLIVAAMLSFYIPTFGSLFGIPAFVLAILGAVFTVVGKSSFNY
jgi:hypothetical protein